MKIQPTRWAAALLVGLLFSGSGVCGSISTGDAYLEELIAASRAQDLANDRRWLNLLHYHQGLFGNWKSDVDGPDFFLSKDGRVSSQKELETTLRAFFEPEPSDPDIQHPQCRFPARYDWLKDRLSFDARRLPEISCRRFQNWKENIRPQSVTLVFASYYLNNPASMFGHTFLRLGREGAPGGDLTDYTVNFAAQTGSNNGVGFALRGLFGGFPGTFSTEPYYVKIQKYNNLESRDLWEYKLNFDREKVDVLAAHLWEMGPTFMSYYFTNKNCSYQLLPMLEVADPDLRLSEQFRFRAIPVDTLKAVLAVPGLVVETNLRPSHLRQMEAGRARLTVAESQLARGMINDHDDVVEEVKALPPERRALVLDSAFDYLRYRKGFFRFPEKEVQHLERRILLLRHELPIEEAPVPAPIAVPDLPQSSHKSGRLDVGFGLTRNASFQEFKARAAIHDLIDDPQGFVEGSELEMFPLVVRHRNDTGAVYLEKFHFINIRSFQPLGEWVKKPSWGFRFGFENAKDLNKTPHHSTYFGVSGESGVSMDFGGPLRGLIYGVVDMDSGCGGTFNEGYRLGVGGSAGMLMRVLSPWRIHARMGWMRYGAGALGNVTRLSLAQSYSFAPSWSARLVAERLNHYQELVFSINRYY